MKKNQNKFGFYLTFAWIGQNFNKKIILKKTLIYRFILKVIMKYVLNGTNAFIIYVENCSLRIYVYIKKTGSKGI